MTLGPSIQKELIQTAIQAMASAYAPYSKFHVGAALLADNGKIYSGCNVENAAYPEGQCAETSAIGAMVAAGAREIAEVLVLAEGERLCTPCGGCRQRLAEFAEAGTPVHVAGPEGVRRSFTLGELLPEAFFLEQEKE